MPHSSVTVAITVNGMKHRHDYMKHRRDYESSYVYTVSTGASKVQIHFCLVHEPVLYIAVGKRRSDVCYMLSHTCIHPSCFESGTWRAT